MSDSHLGELKPPRATCRRGRRERGVLCKRLRRASRGILLARHQHASTGAEVDVNMQVRVETDRGRLRVVEVSNVDTRTALAGEPAPILRKCFT
jgi:hypothetical protein